jgi:8-oxo-dGTP pyrophosphatase MutT (NUDIX family)
MNEPPIPRDAASLVLVRRDGPEPRVLMGQRGVGARFMPSKYVFPGGALDPADAMAPDFGALSPGCARRLARAAPEGIGAALAMSALRETFEETGLAIAALDPGARALTADAPASWRAFIERGLRPTPGRLRFFFRAITPPTRPVRFDARFFLADAADVAGDPDDLSGAGDELGHLGWLTLSQARSLDLPFITTVVLAEAAMRLRDPSDRPAPFFRHEGGRSYIDALD